MGLKHSGCTWDCSKLTAMGMFKNANDNPREGADIGRCVRQFMSRIFCSTLCIHYDDYFKFHISAQCHTHKKL